jgi:hypothetical protein
MTAENSGALRPALHESAMRGGQLWVRSHGRDRPHCGICREGKKRFGVLRPHCMGMQGGVAAVVLETYMHVDYARRHESTAKMRPMEGIVQAVYAQNTTYYSYINSRVY